MTTNDRAESMLMNYAAELARLRRENALLRHKVEPKHGYHRTTHPRILRDAHETALRILVAQATGESISRESMADMGISRTKRYWAIGLLRFARIMQRDSTDFLIDDFLTAEHRLDCKFNELVSEPNALERLRLYLPKSMERMYTGLNR